MIWMTQWLLSIFWVLADNLGLFTFGYCMWSQLISICDWVLGWSVILSGRFLFLRHNCDLIDFNTFSDLTSLRLLYLERRIELDFSGLHLIHRLVPIEVSDEFFVESHSHISGSFLSILYSFVLLLSCEVALIFQFS